MELKPILEALLIASPDPLTAAELSGILGKAAKRAREELAEAQGDGAGGEGEGGSDASAEADRPELAFAGVTPDEVRAALDELAAEYTDSGRAFALLERAEGWKLFTRGEFAPWVRHLFPERKPERLSAPALETLAIIAYRQPITKSAIEAVRGVSVDGVLQKLLDRHIVRIAGRAELPGRPLLYETTDLFFEHFGIRSVDDLPNAAELRAVQLPEPEPPPGDGDGDGTGDGDGDGGEAGSAEEGGGGEAPASETPSEPEAASPEPEGEAGAEATDPEAPRDAPPS